MPHPTAFVLLAAAAALASATDQEPFFRPYFNNTPPIHAVSKDRWDTLNASVTGRLHQGVPLAKPCFARFEGQDVQVEDKECAVVRKDYRNEKLRTARPGGQINTQWETCQARSESCLLDFADPFDPEAVLPPHECHLGSISAYYIDVREPSDVSAAFDFSRSTEVPLVIKNTGHDYKGRSSAPLSLALWTHNLKDISYNPGFIPSGCSASSTKPQQAVTLGAGVQWFEAYAFAQDHNVTLVGGADRTVGTTGGWLQGGGHGALTNTMGMGADRVLEFTAVTPDGVTRTINACQNEDLFFALRGGGGGTFAVVLSATSLASPVTKIQAALVSFPAPADGETELTRELWSILIDNGLRWAKEGWGAYVNANSALYLNPVLEKDVASQSIAPLLEFGNKLKDASAAKEGQKQDARPNVVVVNGEWDSWAHCYNTFADGNSADLGEPLAIASRLIPASLFDTVATRTELLDALVEAQRMAPGVRFLVTTPFNYPGEPGATSVHPAWRTSIFHVTIVTTWNWNATLAEVGSKYNTAAEAADQLRGITKDQAAAYVNEADVYESDHEETFWGDNYPQLLEIKNKYDPDRLLDCWHCVGWDSDSPRFSCYV